jgi:hypothetical protein
MIFVCIPTLQDKEIVPTVKNLFAAAADPSSIRVGIAATLDNPAFKKLKSDLAGLAVEFVQLNPTKNYGVGAGRKAAFSMYAGEDYILQCDSHTFFQADWDTFLLENLAKATEVTGNPKTLLTAYLGRYRVVDGVRELMDEAPRYPVFIKSFLKGTSLPEWADAPKTIINPARVRKDEFWPCTKTNANFIFAPKAFAEYTGLEETSYFFEEELTQGINMVGAGWSLAWPNKDLPLTHLYAEDLTEDSNRQNVAEITPKKFDTRSIISANYNRFLSDPANAAKLAKWHAYTRVHPRFGAAMEHYIPEKFSH